MRKFFRGICGVLATLLTLCILLMAAGLMGVRAFGITPYVVPADMEGLPWSAGALLYVRPVSYTHLTLPTTERV